MASPGHRHPCHGLPAPPEFAATFRAAGANVPIDGGNRPHAIDHGASPFVIRALAKRKALFALPPGHLLAGDEAAPGEPSLPSKQRAGIPAAWIAALGTNLAGIIDAPCAPGCRFGTVA